MWMKWPTQVAANFERATGKRIAFVIAGFFGVRTFWWGLPLFRPLPASAARSGFFTYQSFFRYFVY
jgi:hypothetical protein